MRNLINALIIPAQLNAPVRVEPTENSVENYQSLVAGNIEAITGNGWHVLLNDQAMHLPLPLNPRAEVLIREAGVPLEDTVGGTAVFLGHGSSGNDANVPGHVVRLAERLFETRLAA